MDYRSLYAAEREILALYLFGSAATGGWTRLSDIDLVVPNEAPPLLKHRVVTRGRVVFCRDERGRSRLEARTILEYLDFKPVLEIQYRCLKRRLEGGRFGVRPRYHKITSS